MKYIKYSFLIILCVGSFYVSDQLLLYVESLSPLMQTINEYEDYGEELPVNAIIDGNTIIPGKNGKVINKRESYLKMNDFGTFNETFFVYDYIKPDISLKDNLDKIIIGSSDTTSVALIVDNEPFEKYLLQQKIFYTKLADDEEDVIDNEFIEYINSISDEEDFYDLNYYFKRKKVNKKMCLVGYSNMKACKDNNYYLITSSLDFYKSNIAMNKSKISGGSIIFIHDNLSLSECKIILNEINYNNLGIVKLSEFISE